MEEMSGGRRKKNKRLMVKKWSLARRRRKVLLQDACVLHVFYDIEPNWTPIRDPFAPLDSWNQALQVGGLHFYKICIKVSIFK